MRRTNIISNIILFAVTLSLIAFTVVMISGYSPSNTILTVALYLAGALAAAIVCVIVHELGHIFSAKKNGFKITAVKIFFLLFTVKKGRVSFDFTSPFGEAGATELIPFRRENMAKRLKKMTLGGIVASGVLCAVGVAFAFLYYVLPLNGYCVLSAFLPVSAYLFLDSVLPMINEGMPNDGATVRLINKKDPSMTVKLSVLEIQSEMLNGKSPAEIDENLFFDLPQIREDDFNFLTLTYYRYLFYLDKEDYENAKKAIERLFGLREYAPAYVKNIFLSEALYASCTFDFNEDRADALMYELDKYLNGINDTLSVRAKLAYLMYIRHENEYAEEFICRGESEADKLTVEGQAILERKLFEKFKKDLSK